MTGSVEDHCKFFKKYGVPYDPVKHGTPPDFGGTMIYVPGKGDLPITMNNKIKHISGKHATKFKTPEDYVRAYDGVMNPPEFKAFVSDGNTGGAVEGIKMSDIFGPNFQSRIKGYDKFGKPTVFGPDTKLVPVFTKDANGTYLLKTMYPNP